ncbi:glycosyltransferase family 4 protein [Paenibacillus thermoaerophilus]|uniref:Glycosyltransferase family 4 protein n=1 Tax=Paenibacillus thermoaerophilus TaxID=1215385 RepID=A0ABW2V767_9BACL|nr:glycosyltransferase family 4 protein [Paenibacillus thermoaerophilus]TMV17710.1 glycosyltransferase family 4 protein [Paenibacillus thermoaerophilus]
MKVLFVFAVPSGGVETLNRQRCAALKAAGIEGHCLYLLPGFGLQNSREFPTFVTNDDNELRNLFAVQRYDAMVVVTGYFWIYRFRTLGFTGKIILEFQGIAPKESARELLLDAKETVELHANGLLNPGTPFIDSLIRELYPNTPQFRFNNCLDFKRFSYRPVPRPPHRIVAWLGRIEANKNWAEFLVIGHHLIYGVDRNIRLWMFEDHSLSRPVDRQQFEYWIDMLKLREYLTIRSNVPHDHMPEYFSMIGDSGGFLCCTSKSEGAPYSVLEAMSCRCPVLTTDSEGVRSSVIQNRTGLYYTLGNFPEAVDQAHRLLTDHPLRERLRNEALLHVRRHFDPGHYAVQFKRMLRELGL